MSLSKQDVASIAAYARIALDDAELEDMTVYLNDAMALLEPLLCMDLSGVDPTFHPIGDLANVARDDEPVLGLYQQEALGNARERSGSYFCVPTILADEGGQ